jgi:integration host factor beta subunit
VTKRELVIEVAERLGYTQNEVAAVVQTALDAIVESLAEGHRLEVRNFGVFEVKSRDARTGRNPRTGDEVHIEEKRVATFKPGKALKDHVQNGRPTEQPDAPAPAPSPAPTQIKLGVESGSSGNESF